jgi:hypothetical protein
MTETMPPEVLERFQRELSLIRMEMFLSDDVEVEPILLNDEVVFGPGPREVVWLGIDGSAVTDERFEDGTHHLTVFRNKRIVSETWEPLPR